MKERGIIFSGPMVRAILEGRKGQTRRVVKYKNYAEEDRQVHPHECPYGKPGDLLYVRECWNAPEEANDHTPSELHKEWLREHIRFRADGASKHLHTNWRPGIHLPKWASRTWLEITDVRVERVQEITEEDARAEGVDGGMACETSWRATFRWLWDELNEKRGYGWDANPWVWVIVFKRLEN